MEVADGRYLGRYNAKVQDMDKNQFFIDVPLRQGAMMPSTLPESLTVMVRYRAVDGALCSFPTQVLGSEVRGIPLIALRRPKISQVHRQQRREFLRVPIQTTFELVYMEYYTKKIITAQAAGVDISGGGLAFRVDADLQMLPNDIIGFRFRLPGDETGREVVAKARVIRVAPPQESRTKVVSLKFWEIQESDRQRIVQYSFKRQIEMREKGLLGG